MPSDRSTLSRSPAEGADQRSSWQEPTAPAGRRLPSAPRERKPALAALAVLLILGCALGTGFLVIQSGKRVAAIEISQPIGNGQQIPLSAMTEVQIASNTGLSYVPWDQASQVARYYAATGIPAGTLLTSSMVAATNTSTRGRDVEGLALKDGQLPRGLEVGDHVNIYDVSDATESCPGHPGQNLTVNAVVLAMYSPESTQGSSAQEDIDVALNPANAGAVSCNASNGIVGIAILPDNGRGVTGPGTSSGATHPAVGSSSPGPSTSASTGTGTGTGGTAGAGTGRRGRAHGGGTR
jgi:hypothetical protein